MTFISPRAKIVLFALLIGIALIILLSIVGINGPYNIKYVVLAPALILLFVILAGLERYRRKNRCKPVLTKPSNSSFGLHTITVPG
jgi:hypothetical protein